MHSGGKPYERDQCNCSSRTVQNLKAHSGEKPYPYDQCVYSSTLALKALKNRGGDVHFLLRCFDKDIALLCVKK